MKCFYLYYVTKRQQKTAFSVLWVMRHQNQISNFAWLRDGVWTQGFPIMWQGVNLWWQALCWRVLYATEPPPQLDLCWSYRAPWQSWVNSVKDPLIQHHQSYNYYSWVRWHSLWTRSRVGMALQQCDKRWHRGKTVERDNAEVTPTQHQLSWNHFSWVRQWTSPKVCPIRAGWAIFQDSKIKLTGL